MHINKLKKLRYSFLILAIFTGVCLFSALPSSAQFEGLVAGYTDKFIDFDVGGGAEKSSENKRYRNNYVYEEATINALMHLYWSVGYYKIEDNWAVDEFMRITECDLFRKYFSDEFEWGKIREATKDFIVENRGDFPTRFEFMVPLMFGDYDEKRKAFALQKKYEIDSIRRFEVYAVDYLKPACVPEFKVMHGAPRALVLEFSRPITMLYVPMESSKANRFIKERTEMLQNTYKDRILTTDQIYSTRSAYLFLNVKVFTHGKSLGLLPTLLQSAQMLSILEGYAIYEDINKTKLIYEQTYVTKKSGGKLNVRLKDQYDILREKAKGDGILH